MNYSRDNGSDHGHEGHVAAIQKALDVGVKKGWKLHSCQPTSGYVGVELFNPNRTANFTYLLIWDTDARIP